MRDDLCQPRGKTGCNTLDSTLQDFVDLLLDIWEARWPSGRASDSGARGRGFDPHSGRRVVSFSKIQLPPNP